MYSEHLVYTVQFYTKYTNERVMRRANHFSGLFVGGLRVPLCWVLCTSRDCELKVCRVESGWWVVLECQCVEYCAHRETASWKCGEWRVGGGWS